MNFKKFYYASGEAVIFVDETGDERIADPLNPVFAFGCCIVSGAEIGQIRQDWLQVRKAVCGDTDKSVHMREKRRITASGDRAIQSFFSSRAFGRMSIAITDQTAFDREEMPSLPVVSLALNLMLNETARIMSGRLVQGLSLVFEDGKLKEKILQEAPIRRLSVDGVHVPVNWAFLSKTEGEPCLEIADVIAHSTAGYIRSNRRPDTKFSARYAAIFPEGAAYASGLELNNVEFKKDGQVSTR